tara:strand:- start:240 stop:359 length:120 start_codon:yes stop_codon:yes gene_type:complete
MQVISRHIKDLREEWSNRQEPLEAALQLNTPGDEDDEGL